MSETSEPGADGAPDVPVDPTATAAPPDNAAPPGSAEHDDHADDAGADEPGRKARGVQKRIDELTANWRAEQRRAEELMRTVQTLSERMGTPQQPDQKPGAEPPLPPDLAQHVGPAPDPAKFAAGEYDPEYIRAAARHDMRVDQARQIAAQRNVQAQQAQAQFGQKVASIMDKAVAADPGLAATLQDPSFPIPPHVVRVLAETDMPDAVLAHLAKNREEAARIAKLSPVAVAREFGKIEARLSLAPAAPPAPTAAPPPPRPVRANAGNRPDPDRMSYAEYRAWRMSQG